MSLEQSPAAGPQSLAPRASSPLCKPLSCARSSEAEATVNELAREERALSGSANEWQLARRIMNPSGGRCAAAEGRGEAVFLAGFLFCMACCLLRRWVQGQPTPPWSRRSDGGRRRRAGDSIRRSEHLMCRATPPPDKPHRPASPFQAVRCLCALSPRTACGSCVDSQNFSRNRGAALIAMSPRAYLCVAPLRHCVLKEHFLIVPMVGLVRMGSNALPA